MKILIIDPIKEDREKLEEMLKDNFQITQMAPHIFLREDRKELAKKFDYLIVNPATKEFLRFPKSFKNIVMELNSEVPVIFIGKQSKRGFANTFRLASLYHYSAYFQKWDFKKEVLLEKIKGLFREKHLE